MFYLYHRDRRERLSRDAPMLGLRRPAYLPSDAGSAYRCSVARAGAPIRAGMAQAMREEATRNKVRPRPCGTAHGCDGTAQKAAHSRESCSWCFSLIKEKCLRNRENRAMHSHFQVVRLMRHVPCSSI